MATGARGQGAIQSNAIALGREKNNDEGGREGGTQGGKRRGKYYITPCTYTSSRPLQQSNTNDLSTSSPVTSVFQLVKTEVDNW